MLSEKIDYYLAQIVQNRYPQYSIRLKKELICLSVLITACLVVYWPVFTHEFQLGWDDHWVVINLFTESGFTRENLIHVLTIFYHGQYAPMNELFYMTVYSISGYNPSWFHAASLMVHISNVLLTFFFLLKLLRQSQSFEEGRTLRIAFICSLLMAVHPFLVESVAWLSASKTLVYAFFYLLAMHAYLHYLKTLKAKYYIATLLLFILSFGGKEQAVTMMMCLLLIDYALKRNFRERAIWLEKIPFFVLTIFFIIVTFKSQAINGEGVLSGQKLYPFYQNVVYSFYTLAEYLIKCELPIRLSYIYPFPNLQGEPLPLHLWLYPIAIIMAAIGFWSFWKKPWITFGIAFFIIHISTALNLVPTSRFAIVADRYVYLASIGIFFILAYLLDDLITNKPKYKYAVWAIFLTYFLSLGAYANERCKIWHDSDTLKAEIHIIIKNRPDYEYYKKKLKLDL